MHLLINVSLEPVLLVFSILVDGVACCGVVIGCRVMGAVAVLIVLLLPTMGIMSRVTYMASRADVCKHTRPCTRTLATFFFVSAAWDWDTGWLS